MAETPERVAKAFVNAINDQSVDEITSLMTEDHAFIDALGMKIDGKQLATSAWEAYFRIVPDYTITIDEAFSDGPAVVLLGTARGTYAPDGIVTPSNRWSTPAAWRALVRESLIAEWRVYCDNEPLRRLVARNRDRLKS